MRLGLLSWCTWEGFTEVDGRFVGVHSDLALAILGGSGGATNQA